MKLEKREVTLNEYDSLCDCFYALKTVLNECMRAVEFAEKRQTRSELFSLINGVMEDMYFVRDLMDGSAIENKE